MNGACDYQIGIESNPSITMFTGFKVMMLPGNVAHDVYDRAAVTRNHCLIPPFLCTLLSGFLKHLLGIWSTMRMTSSDYSSPFSLKSSGQQRNLEPKRLYCCGAWRSCVWGKQVAFDFLRTNT